MASDTMIGLTSSEMELFNTFIEQCTEQDLLLRSQQMQIEDSDFGLNDEATLMRFLRGRSFDVPGAVQQFGDAQKLREAVDAVAMYDKIDITEFEKARAMYPHWTGRRDKSGRPICLFDLASLDSNKIAAYADIRCKSSTKGGLTINTAMQHAVVFGDYMTRFVIPLCNLMAASEGRDSPVTNAVYLVDIACMTVRQSWSLRDYSQDFTSMLATCYPEVVERIYILNAPSYFGMIWGILKRMTDPRTAKKLTFVSSADVLETLLDEISVENIPSQFGGEHNFVHGEAPKVEVDLLLDFAGVEKLPLGPLKLINNEKANNLIVAVGTDKDKQRFRSVNAGATVMKFDTSDEKNMTISENKTAIQALVSREIAS